MFFFSVIHHASYAFPHSYRSLGYKPGCTAKNAFTEGGNLRKMHLFEYKTMAGAS